VKAVIRDLSFDTPAEEILDGLMDLGFDVISVKQMSASRGSPVEGVSTITDLHLFLEPYSGQRNHRKSSHGQTLVTLQSEQRRTKLRVALHIVINAKSSAMSGLTADNLPVA
jgi:hypothetical protein